MGEDEGEVEQGGQTTRHAIDRDGKCDFRESRQHGVWKRHGSTGSCMFFGYLYQMGYLRTLVTHLQILS